MKMKLNLLWRVTLALVLVVSMGISVALPVAAAADYYVTLTSPTTAAKVWIKAEAVESVPVSIAAVVPAAAANTDITIYIQKGATIIGTYTTTAALAASPTINNLSYSVQVGNFGQPNEGLYDVVVQIRYPAGTGSYISATNAASGTDAVGIDRTAPTSLVITAPTAGWGMPAAISGTGFDAISGLAHVYVDIVDSGTGPNAGKHFDGVNFSSSGWSVNTTNWIEVTTLAAPATPRVNQTWTYNPAGLANIWQDGEAYTITAKAVDFVTPTPYSITSTTVTFWCDKNNPTITIVPAPKNPAIAPPTPSYYYNASTLPTTVSGTAADAPLITGGLASGIANVKVQIAFLTTPNNFYWNGQFWDVNPNNYVTATITPVVTNPKAGDAPTSGPLNVTWSVPMPLLTDQRTYQVQAIVTDLAGNKTSTAAVAFYYDTLAPTITINPVTPTPISGFVTGITGPFTGTSSGAANVKIMIKDNSATPVVSWNGTAWDTNLVWLAATGTNTWTYDSTAVAAALTNGHAYMVSAQAFDLAMNASAAVSTTFTVDTSAPSSVTINPIGTGGVADRLLTITGTAADAISGIAGVVVVITEAPIPEPTLIPTPVAPAPKATIVPEFNTIWNAANGTWTYVAAFDGFKSGYKYNVEAQAWDKVGNHTDGATNATASFTYESLPWVFMVDPATVFGVNTATFDLANPPTAPATIPTYYLGPNTFPGIDGFAWIQGSGSSNNGPGAVTDVQVKFVQGTNYWNAATQQWVATETWNPTTTFRPLWQLSPSFATYNVRFWQYNGALPPWVDGQTYTITCRAADNSNPTRYTSQPQWGSSFSFIWDSTPPAVTLDTLIPANSHGTGTLFGTYTEAGSGINAVRLQFSGASNWTGTARLDNNTNKWYFNDYPDYFSAPNGTYTVKVYGVDNALNTTAMANQPSATYAFTKVDDFMILYPGWNFISFPKALAAGFNTFGTLIEPVTGKSPASISCGWAYSPTAGWQQLTSASALKVLDGYWFYVEGDYSTFMGFNYLPSDKNIPTSKVLVGNAWNAIGPSTHWYVEDYRAQAAKASVSVNTDDTYAPNQFKSIETSWSTLIGWENYSACYDPAIFAPGKNEYVEPGHGYWIWISNPAGCTFGAVAN